MRSSSKSARRQLNGRMAVTVVGRTRPPPPRAAKALPRPVTYPPCSHERSHRISASMSFSALLSDVAVDLTRPSPRCSPSGLVSPHDGEGPAGITTSLGGTGGLRIHQSDTVLNRALCSGDQPEQGHAEGRDDWCRPGRSRGSMARRPAEASSAPRTWSSRSQDS